MDNISDGGTLTRALQGFLADRRPDRLALQELESGLRDRPRPERILCLGKAAAGLAKAAASLWPEVPGLLYGTAQDSPAPAGFLSLRGDHPFPTQMNLQNTLAVERWLEETRGPLLACVSGGGSALLVHPRAPWTLEMKADLTRKLWERGALIADLNAVRCRLSEVKCGGLRGRAGAWPVTTALWSDVGWRDRRLVSSGPTTAWRPRRSAEQVLAHYRISPPMPLPAAVPNPAQKSDACFVLFDAVMLRRQAAAWLRRAGFGVTEVPCREGQPARAAARGLAGMARGARRPRAFVGTGEVRVEATGGAGTGGRCAHLSAELARALLSSRRVSRWAFCALATDGVDGCAGGGAWVDDRSVPERRDLERALAQFDTGSLWERNGTLVPRGATGNNLRDLWVLVVWP